MKNKHMSAIAVICNYEQNPPDIVVNPFISLYNK